MMSIELLRAFLRKSKGSKRHTFINDLFQSMDKDRSRRLDYTEFKNGLYHLGLNDLTEAEFRNIFNEFDTSHDGKIDYNEFAATIRGPLAPCRAKVIDDAFNHLDVNKDGVLSIDDFRVVFNAQATQHPKFLDGSWTLDEVLRSFLDAFDTPGKGDGTVTKQEFHNYYAVVSATVVSDSHFVNMINTTFGL
jgi:Ca2+-binding EF-hand superfamily protein